ncbi:MAG TPA: homocysteine S-methyltransferase family protein [Armatimonadota bacterium]|nr:homocysteine S-methyltransferase family protein [Armatimonadota bacterium]
MSDWIQDLLPDRNPKRPVITDGAWGTQLQERGLPRGACPDEWNLSRPDAVEAVARGYVEAGSEVILTNTFGANRITLRRYGMEARAAEISRQGAEHSRRGAGGRSRVFGSIGPTGALLLLDDVTEEEMTLAFREQAFALAEGGADALVVETMADLLEAEIAVAAACETGLPVVASMVYDSGKDRDRTMMGVSPEVAAAGLSSAGAWAIGANCGSGPETMAPICTRIRAATNLPIWIKPNAGLPVLEMDRTVYPSGPEEFAAAAAALVKAGATFIGGCCGSSPAYIRALVAVL